MELRHASRVAWLYVTSRCSLLTLGRRYIPQVACHGGLSSRGAEVAAAKGTQDLRHAGGAHTGQRRARQWAALHTLQHLGCCVTSVFQRVVHSDMCCVNILMVNGPHAGHHVPHRFSQAWAFIACSSSAARSSWLATRPTSGRTWPSSGTTSCCARGACLPKFVIRHQAQTSLWLVQSDNCKSLPNVFCRRAEDGAELLYVPLPEDALANVLKDLQTAA